jgi:hypothetical protein
MLNLAYTVYEGADSPGSLVLALSVGLCVLLPLLFVALFLFTGRKARRAA